MASLTPSNASYMDDEDDDGDDGDGDDIGRQNPINIYYNPLYPFSTILLINSIDWFFFVHFGILCHDCDIGINLYLILPHKTFLAKIISRQKWQECTFVNNRQYDRTFLVLNNSSNPKTQRRRYISPLFWIQTPICPMPPCVQVWNQIFHGEFQLSDKVGCILAYPGSYPHSTGAHPTIPGYILLVFRIILLQTQYLTKPHAIPRDTSDSQAVHLERHQVPSEPYRSHWEKSIRLSLHDYLHAAYPHSHLAQPPRPSRQNVQTSKYHFDAMSHQQSCIFILHRETSKYNSIFMIQWYQNTTATSLTTYRNRHWSHPDSTSSKPFWPFCLAVRPQGAQSLRQFDLGSLVQIALGTVLPLAWLPDQISLGKFGCTGLV